MPTRFRVWGSMDCSTRPEMKVEKVSYDIITPSAARGICDAIFWHPGLRRVIDRIIVCNPIRFTSVRRNEVKAVVNSRAARTVMEGPGNGSLYIATPNEIQQRASLLLRDVSYVIEAHFEMTDKAAPSDNPAKFRDIMTRRIRKGQAYHQPCMGCREFPTHFAPLRDSAALSGGVERTVDLGYMSTTWTIPTPQDIRPLFFRAVLEDGVLTVPPRDSEEVIG